ncbi:MAG: hypothetical protein RR490_08085 [Niameybacter sp.]
MQKLTRPIYKYWIEDRVYYVDEETQYLIGVDLDGENKKTILLTQNMDKIVLLSDTVLGISNGYNPGIFKVENGKTTQKVKGIVDQSLVNTNNMMYTLYGENEIHFLH